jgi:hypothetical protein
MLARSAIVSFCACVAVVVLTSSAEAGVRGSQFPRTAENIHLEMVFNYLEPDPNVESGVVDVVWGSNYATQPAGVYNSTYIPISVDNYTHSIAWYQKHHPDWLEYLCDRTTLAFEFGATNLAPLDFTNLEVQAYQWANWVDGPLAQGFGGIAVDTMNLTNSWQRCGHYDPFGSWVQQYSGALNDARFRHDVLGWEKATYKHVHQYSSTATMQVNVTYEFGEPDNDNLQLMTAADLLLDERGFTNWGVPPARPTPWQWQKIVDVLRQVQSKGLCYMTNGEQSVPTQDISLTDRLWVIANYLLVKNDCTYMYISGSQDYGRLITFPEYSIVIGSARGAMTKTHGVWLRKFSGGLSLVNPYLKDRTVALPAGNYSDVNGNPVGPTVTMPAQSGIVLLKQ